MQDNEAIVFFDGVCNICNRFVDFLLRVDKRDRVKVASLQGSTASKVLSKDEAERFDSIIFKLDGKIYYKSQAVLRILQHVGGFWKIAIIFKIIPRFIADCIYSIIAQNRFKWFGKRKTCRMPTLAEKSKLLP
jgi:predicted DCC family thiol-disulfide oxidoreductase YuxK